MPTLGLLPKAKVDPYVIYAFWTEEAFGEADLLGKAGTFLRSESMGAEGGHPLAWDRAASHSREEAGGRYQATAHLL